MLKKIFVGLICAVCLSAAVKAEESPPYTVGFTNWPAPVWGSYYFGTSYNFGSAYAIDPIFFNNFSVRAAGDVNHSSVLVGTGRKGEFGTESAMHGGFVGVKSIDFQSVSNSDVNLHILGYSRSWNSTVLSKDVTLASGNTLHVDFDWSDIGRLAFTTDGGLFGVNSMVVTALPEPSTYAMMAAGLGMVGWIARRKKQQ